MIEIKDLSLEEWLTPLDTDKRHSLIQLVDLYGEEHAAKKTLIQRKQIYIPNSEITLSEHDDKRFYKGLLKADSRSRFVIPNETKASPISHELVKFKQSLPKNYDTIYEDDTSFWDRFKKEFDSFLCDENAYKKEKEMLLLGKNAIGVRDVVGIASILSPMLGVNIIPSMIISAIILLLYLTAKMGIKSYCQNKVFV